MKRSVHDDRMQRPPGAWSLAPGQSTLLRPRECGYLRIRGGRLWANGGAMEAGESVRVWSGEQVQLRNMAGSEAGFFSWDYCARQPHGRARFLRERLAEFAARLAARQRDA